MTELMPPDRPADRTPALPPGPPSHLDEAQAALVLRRAAELQAEAAEAQAGYRTADVAASAEEAGIAREYVERALAELPRDVPSGVALGTASSARVSEPVATRDLGTDRRSVAVSVELPAALDDALRALGTALQCPPYELRLRTTIGEPRDGGALVFDLPGVVGAAGEPGGAVNLTWTATRYQLETRQLQLTLRPLDDGTGAGRTLATMAADLRPGLRRNVLTSRWLAGAFGGGAGLTTGFMLAQGAAAVASAAVLGPAVGVAAAVAGLSLYGYRRSYATAVRTAESEMRRALEAVASALRAATLFGA